MDALRSKCLFARNRKFSPENTLRAKAFPVIQAEYNEDRQNAFLKSEEGEIFNAICVQ
jgi:hypothetical protein